MNKNGYVTSIQAGRNSLIKGMNMKQCRVPSVNAVDKATATREQLEQALDEAEEKAHKNLARYKFMDFGYWAAIWVHLNQVGNFHRPNPFSAYVELAKNEERGKI